MERGPAEVNASLQQAVLQELKWDPLVEEAHVGADADNYTVTLWGTVATWAQRHAAAAAAHRVTGVLDVVNSVAVEPQNTSARTDLQIVRALRRAVGGNVQLPASRIKSTICDGVVTLEGDVATRMQQVDAERTVRFVAGVHAVVNLLKVEAESAGVTAEDGCACATEGFGTHRQ